VELVPQGKKKKKKDKEKEKENERSLCKQLFLLFPCRTPVALSLG